MTEAAEVLAWHWTADTLRDGRAIPPVGETLRHEGRMVICESGLHASERLIDALSYAPGPTLHRVRCGGDIIRQDDKLCVRERTIIWSHRVSGDLLRSFARQQALSVLHLWDAPEIVKQYLATGNETLRDAAWAAARAAAWDAAWDAARDAAWAAAWDAARAAAWDAAWDAARDAARAAAWDAAWDAARDAAWAAARDAAWAAARDAAWDAARDAARAAAWDAAWAAARDAAWDAANTELTRLVLEEANRTL